MRSYQAGMSMWQLIVVIAIAAIFGTVALKSIPVYLNQMKVTKAVKSVASDSSMAKASPVEIRRALDRHWNVDDITRIQPKDVKIVRAKTGRMLRYEYEAREKMFYNISIVYEFSGEERRGGGGNGGGGRQRPGGSGSGKPRGSRH